MAARKLQSEIDRTLKRVAEGVEQFESIYDKMQQSTNQTQKEKQEADLKTQIKKLQRLRDQIKTWVAGNDIKDKAVLIENRKLIETQMERFKACEKEMKTKAFSKIGLTATQKLTPEEKEKHEMISWLGNMVEELSRQVEATEAEVASLQVSGKKKKAGAASTRADELSALNSRRTWHISRLELILRLLENGTLTTEAVGKIKEDVAFFVESNTEEDFEEDEGIYDELNLEEQQDAFGNVNDETGHSDDDESTTSDLPTRTPSKDSKSKSSQSVDDDHSTSPVMKKQSLASRKADKVEPPKPPIAAANFASQPMSQALKNGLSTGPAPIKHVMPTLKYAAAAAGSTQSSTTQSTSSQPTAPSTSTSIPPLTPSSAVQPISQQQQSPKSPTASVSAASMSISPIVAPSHASRATPPPAIGTSTSGSVNPDSRAPSPSVQSPVDEASVASPVVQSVAPSSAAASPLVASIPPSESQGAQSLNGASKATLPGNAPAPSQQQPLTANTSTSTAIPGGLSQLPPISAPVPSAVPSYSQPPTPGRLGTPGAPGLGAIGGEQLQQQPQQQQRTQTRTNLPPALGDLGSSFDAVKSKASQRMSNPEQLHKVLEAAMNGVPQATDADKPRYYVPRSHFNSPSYYPQTPLSLLSTPQLFAQLDVETLFYVFYFLPGTYQQYLAANELKRQSWRFHVKYLTWFQRHSEPQAITEEYEQGVYVYFDWEGSWCQRKKSDFRFEYRYLSED